MRKLDIRFSVAFACTGLVFIGACADVTSPVAPLVARDSSSAALSKSGAPSYDAQAYALLVRISSVVLGTTVVDRYSFVALKQGSDVTGKFEFVQMRNINGVQTAVVIAAGSIVCVHVDAHRARVGGRIDFTTFPLGIPVGSEITWSVTDNGQYPRAKDSASEPLGNNARAYCDFGLPYPEYPVERGTILVRG